MNHGDVFVGSNSQAQKPKTVIKLKKQEVKKVKYVTPGLKHYASVGQKYVARNDYGNYFRSRHAQEERYDASQRLVQNMYRRNPRALLMPQYAPTSLNYDSL